MAARLLGGGGGARRQRQRCQRQRHQWQPGPVVRLAGLVLLALMVVEIVGWAATSGRPCGLELGRGPRSVVRGQISGRHAAQSVRRWA